MAGVQQQDIRQDGEPVSDVVGIRIVPQKHAVAMKRFHCHDLRQRIAQEGGHRKHPNVTPNVLCMQSGMKDAAIVNITRYASTALTGLCHYLRLRLLSK